MVINQMYVILINIYRVGKLLIKVIRLIFSLFIIKKSGLLNLKRLFCLVEFSFILFSLIMLILSREIMDKIKLIYYLIVQIQVKFSCKFMKSLLKILISHNNLQHGIYYQHFYNKKITISAIILFLKLLKIILITVMKIIQILINIL